MRYDIETFLADIEQLMKDNLNTEIQALNTEKGNYPIKVIPAGAYFCQTLDGKEVNFDPYIFYGIEAIESDTDYQNYGASAENVKMVVCVVLADEGTDVDLVKKLFRYQRALKETFEKNFNSMSSGVKLAIESQVPVDLQLMNSKFRSKVIGVTIQAFMA